MPDKESGYGSRDRRASVRAEIRNRVAIGSEFGLTMPKAVAGRAGSPADSFPSSDAFPSET